jgi:phosphoribosylanthranilate isomerase
VAAAIAAGFDFAQIHFDPEHPAARERVAAWVAAAGRSRLWLAPRSAPGGQWPEWVTEAVGTIVFDGYKAGEFGGTGRVADLARFADLRRKFPRVCWVLAGGLGPDTLSTVLGSGADIFDLNSGVEDAPGVKSAAKLAAALGSAGSDRSVLETAHLLRSSKNAARLLESLTRSRAGESERRSR